MSQSQMMTMLWVWSHFPLLPLFWDLKLEVCTEKELLLLLLLYFGQMLQHANRSSALTLLSHKELLEELGNSLLSLPSCGELASC